jgi:hypothetical protein
VHWDFKWCPGLLLLAKKEDTASHMLTAHLHNVRAPLSGVEQKSKREPGA